MDIKKIYISGKISGLNENDAVLNFDTAEKFLKQKYPDAIIINPFKVEHNHDLTWESYMRNDLIAMLYCDTIYMLRNWVTSKGAIMEFNTAKQLNFNILFE